MENLDAVASSYLPDGAAAIENDLILHWYPKRIINRFTHCDTLLELGIGHGYTASLFNEVSNRHTIIEGSQIVIDHFRENNPDFSGELVHDFFETFETKDQFDVIVMGFVLEHVDDPDMILAHYRQLLKPDGKIYVAVPNAKSLNRRLGLEMGLIDNIYSLNANDHALGHKRQFCLDTLRATLQKAGYRVTHEEGIYLKPLPLAILNTLPNFQDNLQAMCKIGIEFPELCVGLLMEVLPE